MTGTRDDAAVARELATEWRRIANEGWEAEALEYKFRAVLIRPDKIDLEVLIFDIAAALQAARAQERERCELAEENARQAWAAYHADAGAQADIILERERYREALTSIATNTCCESCQEAALVAAAALRGEG